MSIDYKEILGSALTKEQTLSSIYDIEEILLIIQEINRKIDYYKDYKRNKVQTLDTKISHLTAKVDSLRGLILTTMQTIAPKEKTLDFPDVGKVVRKKGKESLNIEDEESVLKYLDQKGRKAEVVKVVQSIDKRELNAILNEYQKSGERVPGAIFSTGEESIAITFEKPKEQVQENHSEIKEVNLEELDALLV